MAPDLKMPPQEFPKIPAIEAGEPLRLLAKLQAVMFPSLNSENLDCPGIIP